MQDEPEGTLLEVFADVAINHGEAEFAEFTGKKMARQGYVNTL
jgi:hypothetical protein